MASYRFGDEIGKGAYGTVFKATNLLTNKLCAVKCIMLNEAGEREVKALMKVGKHAHVVEYRSFRHRNRMWIEMEYCNGGNLNTYFWTHRPDTIQKHDIMTQMAKGVAHLHKSKVIHRDLKPDNILIMNLKAGPHVKIADFGIAKAILTSQCGGDIHQYFMFTRVGTEFFTAPEVLEGCYTLKADIFSMGVVFAALMKETSLSQVKSKYLAAFVPWGGKELPIGRFQHTYHCDVPLPPGVDTSKSLPRLIQSMIRLDDNLRPSAATMVSVLEGIPQQELHVLHEQKESWKSRITGIQLKLILAFLWAYFISIGGN